MAGMENIYDILAKENEESRQVGIDYSKIREGGVAAAVMAQAGGMLGGSVMQAAGFKTAAQKTQEGREQLQQMHPNPTTYQDMVAMANDAKNLGLSGDWELIMKRAEAMKTTATASDTRGAMQKSVEYMASINQCSAHEKGTPEYTACMRKSIQDAEDYKRVGEEEFGNKQGIKNFQTAVGDSLKNQTQVRKQLSTLNNLKRLAPRIYTGLGQDGVQAWNRLGTVLGFETATDDQAATEAFRSGGLEIAMGFIHNTKGAVSDMEMAKFIEASPNLHNTEKGNLLIINFAIAQQELEKKLNVEMNRFSRNNRDATMSDWNFHADEFLNREENQISIKMREEFDAAFNDPAYTGIGEGINTDTDASASNDIQSQIDALK